MRNNQLREALFTLVFIVIAFTGKGQIKIVTLHDALNSAEDHFPALKQKELLKEISKQNLQLLDASLFPQVSATGQATFQSEVTSFSMPGFTEKLGQKPDNYNVGLDLRFPFTQFGAVRTRKELEEAQTNLSITQVDVSLQQVRERVTNLMGNLLLQKENMGILRLRLTDLDSQRRKVKVGVSNGAVLKSNQLILESEILSTEQRIDDISAMIKGLTKQLSIITGLSLDSSTKFQIISGTLTTENFNRPELKVFQMQRNVLDERSQLLKKESHPNLYIFAEGFYGRPGYNFLNTSLRTYGIAGIGLNWNLNNMLTQSKQQNALKLNKEIVSSQEATFNQSLETTVAEKIAEIEKYQSIISKDAQIVIKRKEILRTASSQLTNGVITSTEYLQELNAQNTAELNLTLHQVQSAIAKAQYNTLLGY